MSTPPKPKVYKSWGYWYVEMLQTVAPRDSKVISTYRTWDEAIAMVLKHSYYNTSV